MPKVCLSEKQKDHERLISNLLLIQSSKQRTNAQMGQVLGISSSAYSNRKRNPEKMTYKEIKRLCDYAKVDISTFICGYLKLS